MAGHPVTGGDFRGSAQALKIVRKWADLNAGD